MYFYSKTQKLPDDISISLKRYGINIDHFNPDIHIPNKPLLVMGEINYQDLKKIINKGFIKIILISGDLCDECIKYFGYKRINNLLDFSSFKFKLFSNETFKKVFERLPIDDVSADIHYGDEWIYNGLPSYELLSSNKSPIRILSKIINVEEKIEDLSIPNHLSLCLENIENKSINVPISKVVKINKAYIQHWNISTGGFESAIGALFETFITTQINKFDNFSIPLLLESFACPEISIICPRLDCDEAISSANLLFDLYDHNSLNLNLAITTNQIISDEDKEFINKVKQNGGTISNHSHSHKTYWSLEENKFNEDFKKSKNIIAEVSNFNSTTCVAPFHQSNKNLVKSLDENNVQLLITGNSKYSPEHMIGIGGQITKKNKIVVHSQQCMLHGDSWPSLKEIYFNSFNLAARRQAIFGYLDHPLSIRYDYGWGSYERQLEAHSQLLKFFKANYIVKAISHEDLSDWLKVRSLIELDFKNLLDIRANIKKNAIKELNFHNKNVKRFKNCQVLFNNQIKECKINYI